jgi:transposase
VSADVAGMTNDTDMTADLVGGSYEARKSAVRCGSGSGVEVRVRAVRRRTWSTEDKLRIVRETLEPGAVAKAVADRHGISTGLLFTWRKEMLATAVSGFVPVDVVAEVPKLGKRHPIYAG